MVRWVIALGLVFGGASLAGCAENEEGVRAEGPPGQARSEPVEQAKTGDVPPGAKADEKTTVEAIPLVVLDLPARGKLVAARPISPRSLSLRVVLEGGGKAVFKPLRKHNGTAAYEVAYYRLATTLGLEGVPPSTISQFPLSRLAGHLRKNYEETSTAIEAEARVNDQGMVTGAVMEWVEGLSPSGLDGATGRRELKRLLALDGPDHLAEPLVAQASKMVAVDYVLGNWDRFTGGNLFANEGGTRLVLIDNNAAFAPWSKGQENRMTRSLETCFRFSRELDRNFRLLDRSAIERIMGDERNEGGRPLLSGKEIERTLERRDRLISRVDGLIKEHGGDRVLSLP